MITIHDFWNLYRAARHFKSKTRIITILKPRGHKGYKPKSQHIQAIMLSSTRERMSQELELGGVMRDKWPLQNHTAVLFK